MNVGYSLASCPRIWHCTKIPQNTTNGHPTIIDIHPKRTEATIVRNPVVKDTVYRKGCSE